MKLWSAPRPEATAPPAGSSSAASNSIRIRIALALGPVGHQHFAVAVRLHRRDHARMLHLLDQARRAVVADPEVPLHQRDGSATRAQYDFHRLIVKGIGLAARFGCAVRLAAGFVRIEHAVDVIGPVSYTHLTLPTNREVSRSVGD